MYCDFQGIDASKNKKPKELLAESKFSLKMFPGRRPPSGERQINTVRCLACRFKYIIDNSGSQDLSKQINKAFT
jgi:hypothetical protein